MLGLFGDQISPHFEEQQYIDEKASYYSFSNETKAVTKNQMEEMLKDFLEQRSEMSKVILRHLTSQDEEQFHKANNASWGDFPFAHYWESITKQRLR